MPITIYRNPKCAKSRATLALIAARGIKPVVIEYLKTPPDKTTLIKILKQLDMMPRELLRTKEPEFRELKLDNPKLTDSALLTAMVKHPRLIERPIVTDGRRAVLGRPPENVLRLLK